MSRVQIEVPLSRLVAGKRNPRRVKPSREAHHRLIALIRSQGLSQPLLVRPMEEKPKYFIVIAGNRRLAALKEIHRGDGDPKIPCILRDVNAATADALSLGENFGREPMHPLDEAEAFAKLATADGKDAKAIASEFGVTEQYVRQRMKLATLTNAVKEAYRTNAIDTAMAEAFASVPEGKQLEVWKEVNGHPRHAEHVRNIIANDWIDASYAVFQLTPLPESAVSRDLFSDRVLVERQAFMEAQTQAMDVHRQALIEEGWSEVVAGRREDVQDRLFCMDTPEPQYDDDTTRKLQKIATRRQKLEASVDKIDEGDESRLNRLNQRLEGLEVQEREIVKYAPVHFSEETKAIGTAFLILDPVGKVHREYRVPRKRHHPSASGNGSSNADGAAEKPKVPTSDDLSDSQCATTFTHQALAVRQALLKNPKARKRVLALILHEKVRSEALSIRHEPNGTTLHAASEGFASAAFDEIEQKRAKLDPFLKEHFISDTEAYEKLIELSDYKIDGLIDLLTIECIMAHMIRKTELVRHLADELKVNIRDHWRPDAKWLVSFTKLQLAHLITGLKGPVHAPAPERKKSDLVGALATLFADASAGKFEDKQLAEKANRWLPSNLRESTETST